MSPISNNVRNPLLDSICRFYLDSKPPAHQIQASSDKPNSLSLKTPDGYQIDFAGKDEQWTITDSAGRTTKIWGDPHVKESDGDRWDFVEQSTFSFGNNKITVRTNPSSNYPGKTYSSEVTLYHNDERITVGGIDKNSLNLLGWEHDATAHDSGLDDGTHYQREISNSGAESWVTENE